MELSVDHVLDNFKDEFDYLILKKTMAFDDKDPAGISLLLKEAFM